MSRKKPYRGLPMEGVVASWYSRHASTNRDFESIAAAVASRVPPGGSVLEVAPGPGILAIEIARRGAGRVAGLDVSRSFVRIARENAARAGVAIEFTQGDAARMPYPDASFDAAVCVAAFKNFSDPAGAIDEMFRVLRPGGTAWIHDLRKDASLRDVEAEVTRMRLSPVNALLTRLTFRHVLLPRAYTQEDARRLAERSRFGGGTVTTDGIGFVLELTRPRAAAN